MLDCQAGSGWGGTCRDGGGWILNLVFSLFRRDDGAGRVIVVSVKLLLWLGVTGVCGRVTYFVVVCCCELCGFACWRIDERSSVSLAWVTVTPEASGDKGIIKEDVAVAAVVVVVATVDEETTLLPGWMGCWPPCRGGGTTLLQLTGTNYIIIKIQWSSKNLLLPKDGRWVIRHESDGWKSNLMRIRSSNRWIGVMKSVAVAAGWRRLSGIIHRILIVKSVALMMSMTRRPLRMASGRTVAGCRRPVVGRCTISPHSQGSPIGLGSRNWG